MAPRVVHIHIGSTKTGTTFIQHVLWANREQLATHGVLLPGDRRFGRVQAARELTRWDPTKSPKLPPTWKKMVKQIDQWRGDSVILSQEFLSWLEPNQIKAMLAPLAQCQVKIILTTRDLARLIPAQWQSAMRQCNAWTLTEYAQAVAGQKPKGERHAAYQHFWKRQDYGSILNRWIAEVGLQNVTVVTLPPSGTDPDELWRRFCQATDLEPERYKTGGVSNASLGAASSEIMRRLNATAPIKSMDRQGYSKSVNGTLSRRVLDLRRSQESGLSMPEKHREWTVQRADEIIAEIQAINPTVIGDLDDLRPPPSKSPYQAPEKLPPEELLAAAIDGLAGLAVAQADVEGQLREHAKRKRRSVGAPRGALDDSEQ